jgi:hypothetical protein
MGAEIFGQRYDASGNRIGGVLALNPLMSAQVPAAAVAADGSLVVVWEQLGAAGGLFDLGGRRFNASGSPLGGAFLVTSHTTGVQNFADVAMADNGDFVVVWIDHSRDGDSLGIFAQRFDAQGTLLGDDFQVNTSTTDLQRFPAAAADAEGNLVVVWDSNHSGSTAVFGQRYDPSGNPIGGEFAVSELTGGFGVSPDVASDAAGNFVVTWSTSDIFARRFDASGSPLGSSFQVNTYTTDSQSWPEVASDADGDFVVVWESEGQDGSLAGIFGQQFDSDGSPRGEEFRVNTYTSLRQIEPVVSADDDGDFVVVWEKIDSSQSAFNVKGQLYAGPGLHLEADGTCPGPVSLSIANALPNTEVALVPAANTNSFVKGAQLCPGTRLEIGEPFQLPPTFVIVDGEGRGSANVQLGAGRCFVEALALADCQTSGAVSVPASTEHPH